MLGSGWGEIGTQSKESIDSGGSQFVASRPGEFDNAPSLTIRSPVTATRGAESEIETIGSTRSFTANFPECDVRGAVENDPAGVAATDAALIDRITICWPG